MAVEKETRIMRVTLTKEEFERYDSGEIASNKGLRDKKGRLCAHPDISPITGANTIEDGEWHGDPDFKSDTPNWADFLKSVVTVIAIGIAERTVEVLNEPEVQEALVAAAKRAWNEHIKPGMNILVRVLKGDPPEIKASRVVGESDAKGLNRQPDGESKDEMYIVSGEQAEILLAETRKAARELSAMIFILSNIAVKDSKSQEEITLEQSYIKQLVSDEARNAMTFLVQNQQFIEKDAAQCFTDFLNGYLRKDGELIELPC